MTDKATYRVNAKRSGAWWAIEVDGVPGAITQARRLDQVQAMAREVVSLMLKIPESAFDLVVVPHIGEELEDQVSAAVRTRKEADRLRIEAAASSERAATLLAAHGFPLRDIGELLGVSFQRAQQLASRARAAEDEKLPRLDSNQQPAG